MQERAKDFDRADLRVGIKDGVLVRIPSSSSST